MHGGLLSVTFCPSVCLSVCAKILEKKSKVKVTINVKEKAGGLTPTSSCFVLRDIDFVERSITLDLGLKPN